MYGCFQKEKLLKLRQTRDQSSVDSALSALTECAKSGEGNLLDLSIKASRVRCTVGEISDAMENVHGRHVASTRMVSGAYITEYGEGDDVHKTIECVKVRTCMYVCTYVYHMHTLASHP